jgi:MFS family permease
MAALISDYAGPRLATAMFGLVTFFFGIGQIGGPWVAGILAESSGSLVAGFLLAGVLTLIAAGTSVLLPQRKPLN